MEKPAPSDAALRGFATKVANLLAQSAEGRREISAALTAATGCRISAQQAVDRLASIAENRQSLLQQVAALDAPTPQAERIASLLQQALARSRESNRHYRDWVRSMDTAGGGCRLPANEANAAARRQDVLATSAKRRFVAAYNPLARKFGLRTWRETEI